MIDRISNYLGDKLGKYALSHKYDLRGKQALLSYGFKDLIKKSILLIALFIFSDLGKIQEPVLIFIAAFIPLRSCFGGLHLGTRYSCMISSIVIPLLAGYIAAKVNLNILTVIAIYGFGYITIVKVGVVDHINKPLSEREKSIFKLIGTIILTIIFIINIYSGWIGKVIEANAIAIATIFSFANLCVAAIYMQPNKKSEK